MARRYHGNVEYKTKTERLDAHKAADIERAASILRRGGLVAFPTETVYGLAANALSAEAVAKIFAAKQRPHWDPLIVHLCDLDMLAELTSLPILPLRERPSEGHRHADHSLRATRALIHRFWPGPLTLLLPRSERIPDAVTAGRPLVGLRMPSHSVARRLIERAGVPLAAPSANRFGHTSPTTAAHVLADLDGRIDAVLDGGPTDVGLESTVAEVVPDGVIVYRAGAVDLQTVGSHEEIGWVRAYEAPALTGTPESLPSPGVGLRHYAPRARLILVGGVGAEELSRKRSPIDLSLVETIDRQALENKRVGVLLPDGWHAGGAQLIYRWGGWKDGETLARRLFAGLRELDDGGATVIVCPVPAMAGIGEAIRDRLGKAARIAD
jgi:L-threonylcarbamoyladenylate synthase